MTIPPRSLVTAVAFAAAAPLAACDDSDPPPPPTTLVDAARAAGNFTTLVAALEATGLDAALSGEAVFTVFAPTDAAFARLQAGVVASLDAATLERILTYHVVAGEARAAQVTTLSEAETLEGSSVKIATGADGVFLDGRTAVVATDVLADNGVIHVLDSVLLPPDLAFPGTLVDAAIAYPRFSTLVDAATDAGLADDLVTDGGGGGLTLFAPTNAAFAALGIDLGTLTPQQLADVLLYHVVAGTVDAATVVGLSSATTLQGGDLAITVANGTVTLNGDVDVIATDLRTSNGILHVIDGVLVPAP
jgi:uncharacterized surface protein with fasciclin (FAS1) repeats